ncbi:AraC family transcriptional regulator [Microvirga pudoricolor]|uniref:AraC family transcriptional regulator n=1 Tax=Microvirga pudoricolor TaxID=2778729 RepID=UPI0019508019|nr:AraC family transcriptional regulator [Microvirga pudoricolor]MBM6595273.1 AraC family transcriptional regulator [Microvirga pudoricolor]
MRDNIGEALQETVREPGQPILIPATSHVKSRQALAPGYIHLGVSREIAAILCDFGVDPDPLIREAGLDPRLFEDSQSIVAFTALDRLYTLCVARTRCPHFGLLVGQRATIRSLDLIGRLMQHSETIGTALHSLVSNLRVQDRAVVASLTVSDDVALLTYAAYQLESVSAEQITEAAVAVSFNALRTLCGAEWRPTEVLLARMPPADSGCYRRHFLAPVRFNQESTTLVFPAKDLKRKVIGADPLLRNMLEEQVRRQGGDAHVTFSDDIRRLLRIRIMSRSCSVSVLAGLLAMHRRTLSRRLKYSGSGYRSIANEIRFEIARQLLEDTNLSLGEVSAALGYSEASAFTRAFRRWSGRTPTAWRCERPSQVMR